MLNTVILRNAINSGQFVELKKDYLYVINDRSAPFIGVSNGPNGILIECHKKSYKLISSKS